MTQALVRCEWNVSAHKRYIDIKFVLSNNQALRISFIRYIELYAMTSAQDPVTFGSLLKAERKALGKSLTDLARQVHTRRQTIADLEAGKNVGLHIAFAVLAGLGKTVAIRDARPDVAAIQAMLNEADDD